MPTLKNKIIREILRVEGGYVNNPLDSGGETNYGITEKTARAYGYVGEMQEMPVEFAFDVYVNTFWNRIRGDELAELSERVTSEIADTAVNMGVGTASRFLQRMLNVLNKNGSLYADIKIDGSIGKKTLDALDAFLSSREEEGERVLIRGLNCLQGARYVDLAEKRAKDEAFIFGWLLNRVVI